MAYDEGLAERTRRSFAQRGVLPTEKKMFGGLCFMVRGHMTLGVSGDKLMLRLSKEEADAALARPDTRVMDFTGREMKGFLYVAPEGLERDEQLDDWVGRVLAFNATKAPK
ncbi:MAG: TfoX/Sxy family protein [Myxococcales bacterium]|nr:TfoX/Sxy family protein [Myxococcales bacterium]MCB9734212.1 TfoX/Sxy family protein [Deltaproteobacteria bacterium]